MAGELTLGLTARLKDELSALMLEDWEVLIVELSGVEFMDSSGIGLLVAASNRTKQADRGFYLYNPSTPVVKTLKLVNLFNFFSMLRSEEELPGAVNGF
ncbi:MAG: STAS domain-containing protein [Desulfonatronovibrionaceae bacterium]